MLINNQSKRAERVEKQMLIFNFSLISLFLVDELELAYDNSKVYWLTDIELQITQEKAFQETLIIQNLKKKTRSFLGASQVCCKIIFPQRFPCNILAW